MSSTAIKNSDDLKGQNQKTKIKNASNCIDCIHKNSLGWCKSHKAWASHRNSDCTRKIQGAIQEKKETIHGLFFYECMAASKGNSK